MSFTQTHSISIATENGSPVTQSTVKTGGARADLSESIPNGANNAVIYSLDVSQVKAFCLKVGGALTIYTNDASTGSPDDTLTFTEAGIYTWENGSQGTFVLGTDVTALYVTNATGSAVDLEIRAVYDPTA